MIKNATMLIGILVLAIAIGIGIGIGARLGVHSPPTPEPANSPVTQEQPLPIPEYVPPEPTPDLSALPPCRSLPTSQPTAPALTPLQVRWSPLKRLPDLGLTRATNCRKTVDAYTLLYDVKSDIQKIAYYAVGNVTGEVHHGAEVILVVTNDGERGSIDGSSGSMSVSHLLREGSTLTLLAANSESAEFLDPKKSAIDTTSVISELQYPESFPYHGVQFFRTGSRSTTGADYDFPIEAVEKGTHLKKFKLAFTDPHLGAVFTDREGSDHAYGQDGWSVGYSPNKEGFYVQAPDGTFRSYAMMFPSWWNKETHQTAVTWLDGTENTAEYSAQDSGGCGSVNYASVMTALKDTDLVSAGKTASGDTISDLKDPRHPILQNIYTNWYAQTKPPFEDFARAHPVFFWRDPLGRLLKFQRIDYWNGAECGKPVIYLYPPTPIPVSVRVEPKGGMRKSDPPYHTGWNVLATPQGELTDQATGRRYPYLFWEGRGDLYETPRRGFVVAEQDVQAFLSRTLTQLGLNLKERTDFIEFWQPRMTDAPYYFITFLGTAVMNEIAPLTVSPKPDTLIRVLMDFHPLAHPVPVDGYTIQTPTRRGFTVVEWGGVIH